MIISASYSKYVQYMVYGVQVCTIKMGEEVIDVVFRPPLIFQSLQILPYK